MVKRLTFLVLAALGACTFPEQPLPPGDRLLVVHAVLDPSKTQQVINLGITDGWEATLDRADVSLTLPDGRVLTARQDSIRDSTGKFLYTLPDYRIDLQAAGVVLVPGGKYQLRVATQGGEVVTGETTIPAATPSTMPPPTIFTRSRDTLHLEWTPVASARNYEVQVWSVQSNRSDYLYSYDNLTYQAFRDGAVTLPGTVQWLDDDVFPFSVSATARSYVYVYAVDENYYEYYRLLGDPFRGAAPSRLKGGVGVFGSAVPIIQRQLIVK